MFAIPTYVFIGVGRRHDRRRASPAPLLGDPPVASSAEYAVQAESLTQAAVILLVLRAFSSGCSALTGVEAVSNGVPAFRQPKVRNAQMTLVLMGGIAIVLFAGLTALALVSGVHYAENPCHLIGFDCDEPAAAEPHGAGRGGDVRRGHRSRSSSSRRRPRCVLLLAANTAFNGFPLLGSVLARDGYAPKALNTRGDRLVYSNGMIILGDRRDPSS